MKKKTVSLEMNPLQVIVNVPDNASDEEILKVAEGEVINRLNSDFPKYKYLIADKASIGLEECCPGRMVHYDGKIGYIYEVKTFRKFPISIAFSGGEKLQVKPIGLEAVNDESLLGTVWNERPEFMKEINEWSAGDNAYIPVKSEVKKVVISKTSKTQINASELSTEFIGKYFPLKPSHFHLLFDSEEKAKEFLKKR